MSLFSKKSKTATGLTLVIGGTGKTGSRIVERLKAQNVPVRIGSRSAVPAFDWTHEAGWDACLKDVENVYITYASDLAVPGATDSIRAFVAAAKRQGVKKAVILSGRGEAEAQACEKIVQESGLDWAVVRASWFNQNFSEGAFIEMVQAGQISLPVGDVPEPFIDVDDIADVATAALTDDRHNGEIYEVTGPRLLTFKDIAKELSAVTGRDIAFVEIPHEDFVSGITASGAPQEVVWIMDYLFTTVLDGRNSYITDGVERALGRAPKDFADYANEIAVTDLWRAVA